MSSEQSPGSSPDPTGSSGGANEPATGGRRPAWVVGGVLILLGVFFIIRQVSGFPLTNWWALFILIPAIGSLATALQMYQKNGRRFTAASRGPLVGGLVLVALAAIFLFGIPWAWAWPLFVILAGLGILLSSLERKH
jgi:hypothetical protein